MRKISRNTVFDILKQNKDEFLACGVKRIGVFGSWVRNEQSGESDVDLLLIFDSGKKSYRNFLRAGELAERLLGRRVDVVTDESLSPYIGPYIRKEVEYV